jgi:regulatory protein
MESAVRMLARREHSAFEMHRKLKQKDLDEAEIEEAITALQQEGLLSDERFAESYINMRQAKGYGPVRIAMELRERGVAEAVYEPYLRDQSIDWMAVLKAAYVKKYGSSRCDDYSEKAKRMRYLQYRGFALDKIHELIE